MLTRRSLLQGLALAGFTAVAAIQGPAAADQSGPIMVINQASTTVTLTVFEPGNPVSIGSQDILPGQSLWLMDGNQDRFPVDGAWQFQVYGGPRCRLSSIPGAWAGNHWQIKINTDLGFSGDAPVVGSDGRMAMNSQVLEVNAPLKSANQTYSLIFQSDGNLVLYKSQVIPLWSSETEHRGGTRCVLQSDGNLVIYRDDGAPIWASNTEGNPGSTLCVQDDGNLVIYRTDARPLWATNTEGR